MALPLVDVRTTVTVHADVAGRGHRVRRMQRGRHPTCSPTRTGSRPAPATAVRRDHDAGETPTSASSSPTGSDARRRHLVAGGPDAGRATPDRDLRGARSRKRRGRSRTATRRSPRHRARELRDMRVPSSGAAAARPAEVDRRVFTRNDDGRRQLTTGQRCCVRKRRISGRGRDRGRGRPRRARPRPRASRRSGSRS